MTAQRRHPMPSADHDHGQGLQATARLAARALSQLETIVYRIGRGPAELTAAHDQAAVGTGAIRILPRSAQSYRS